MERLSIDALPEAKKAFDDCLQQTMAALERKGLYEASVTLKLGIDMGRGNSDEGWTPQFAHKVTVNIPMKSSVEGKSRGDRLVIWVEEDECYQVMGGQVSMDELEG